MENESVSISMDLAPLGLGNSLLECSGFCPCSSRNRYNHRTTGAYVGTLDGTTIDGKPGVHIRFYVVK